MLVSKSFSIFLLDLFVALSSVDEILFQSSMLLFSNFFHRRVVFKNCNIFTSCHSERFSNSIFVKEREKWTLSQWTLKLSIYREIIGREEDERRILGSLPLASSASFIIPRLRPRSRNLSAIQIPIVQFVKFETVAYNVTINAHTATLPLSLSRRLILPPIFSSLLPLFLCKRLHLCLSFCNAVAWLDESVI